MAADTAVGMVVDTEVDKVFDKKKSELDMVANKEVDKLADMVAGYRCWLIGPKLFRLACLLSSASLFT